MGFFNILCASIYGHTKLVNLDANRDNMANFLHSNMWFEMLILRLWNHRGYANHYCIAPVMEILRYFDNVDFL